MASALSNLLKTNYSNVFKNILVLGKKETPSNLFYEDSITLKANSENTTKNKILDQSHIST